MKNYNCFKCGKLFKVIYDEEIRSDIEKPACNNCFNELLKINSVKEYRRWINESVK